MSIESALEYIRRMRSDDDFRQTINQFDGSDAAWDYLKTEGYVFTLQEFKQAQEKIYEEYGITPM